MMDVWTSLAISAATTLGVALAVLFGVWLFVRIAGKRLSWLADGYRAIRPRLRFFVVTLALNISFRAFWCVAVCQDCGKTSVMAR